MDGEKGEKTTSKRKYASERGLKYKKVPNSKLNNAFTFSHSATYIYMLLPTNLEPTFNYPSSRLTRLNRSTGLPSRYALCIAAP